ncbi:MFS transporter [Brevibacillus dissolubilis]|uniref:MFS transporter n=1 Tax=Brevibacillus dissolubilis TaxID=1844116 RepID=UPI0011165A27|nr:MFS transporter [Brevibacillus dissolubilis]
MLALFSFAQFLIMQVWFSFSAVLPQLSEEWQLSSTQAGLIVSVFHLGYIVSVFINSFLSDKQNPRRLFIFGAIVAGLASLLFAYAAQGFVSAMLLRFLAGLGIGGIYVPGMKLLSGIYPPEQRGRALGIFVGSLVLGSGMSLLLAGMFVSMISWQGVIIITGISSLVGAAVVSLAKIPPMTVSNHHFSLALIKRVFTKSNVLMNLSYGGHMWELYAMWAWIGPFFVEVLKLTGYQSDQAASIGNMIGALVIMIGAIATSYGGHLSDRVGRSKAILSFILISMVCSFVMGWLMYAPLWILVGVAVIYGFTIIGDSPIYSTALTELSDPDVVGLALGVQSVIGFGITVISPALFGLILEIFAGNPLYQWGMAFTCLGFGAAVTPLCLARLRRLPDSYQMANGKR